MDKQAFADRRGAGERSEGIRESLLYAWCDWNVRALIISNNKNSIKNEA